MLKESSATYENPVYYDSAFHKPHITNRRIKLREAKMKQMKAKIEESCDLFKKIPATELIRVFENSKTISAECDRTFLGFEDIYKAVANFAPKGMTIVDLGCAYAAQAYYFTSYPKYIGVDSAPNLDVHFETDNMEFYHESIQEFVAKLNERGINVNNCFAVCSYVPDKEARRLVREIFPYCLVYYPEGGHDERFNNAI